jgi:transcriptional regulator with XRE-family HTH domain
MTDIKHYIMNLELYTFPDALRVARIYHGLSIKETAEKLLIPSCEYKKMEDGNLSGYTSTKVLDRLAEIYTTKPDMFHNLYKKTNCPKGARV